jgi:hypothetical protein
MNSAITTAQVTLPTLASFDSEGTARFAYDDGPGKTVRATEQWQLSADGKSINMGKSAQPMRVYVLRAGAQADITLAAVGTGEENGAPVLVREMLARRGGCLLISRQTQGLGQPLRTRHAYRLERQQP